MCAGISGSMYDLNIAQGVVWHMYFVLQRWHTHECPPGQVRHALEFIVDEKLRRHHDETERIHACDYDANQQQ